MEEMKKQKVLDTAMELFRLKGYSAASMQDIADACGMAKASIYKFFASKEELFTDAFAACHQNLLDQAAEMEREGARLHLSPRERLQRKIEFLFQYTVENHLFMLDFKELPITTNEHFIAAWKHKKRALHVWRRELLIEAYGDRIEPYIWDVVAIFRGIYIEYLGYVQQKVIALPMAELAAFIVDRMDALVDDLLRKSPRPVIDQLNTHFNYLHPSDAEMRQATLQQLIALIGGKIEQLSQPDAIREELGQVSVMLEAACGTEPANPTLIRVLAAYLDGYPELKPYLRQLHYLLGNKL
ncbi:TetR/AcrR family transcriptional regulator [Paenibacillus aestuarii]|uniref:TetR/AcrR family transcriptional regulator n=1 Tax=Paenibacillus aestuarii TaxID=516965 RepID=A0ABW0KHB2_9BACL|nr:TetR/AcrR family transcriptional regulator [Paenibacillus aestuarii]